MQKMNMRNQKIQTVKEIKEWLADELETREKITGPVLMMNIMQRWLLSSRTARDYLEYLRFEPFVEVGGIFYLKTVFEAKEREKALEDDIRIKSILDAKPNPSEVN